MRILVKAAPGAKNAEVVELSDGTFRVRIDAPAHDNKANLRLIEILAKHFKVSESAIRFISGVASKSKLIEIMK
jgi:uncharacterized protein